MLLHRNSFATEAIKGKRVLHARVYAECFQSEHK